MVVKKVTNQRTDGRTDGQGVFRSRIYHFLVKCISFVGTKQPICWTDLSNLLINLCNFANGVFPGPSDSGGVKFESK